MLTGEGEYYCVNGCLKYPVNNKIIFNLIRYLDPSCDIEKVEYYKVEPYNFNYDQAMNGLYEEEKHKNVLMTADFSYTFTSLEFYSFNLPCRLVFEFFDNDYYGISLLFSSDVSTLKSFRDRTIIPFYQIVNPIYGTAGIEKAIFSLNQIDITDSDVFNSEFMLSDEICEGIDKKHLEKAINVIPIKGVGIYFPQQNRKTYEQIFHALISSI